MSAASTEPASTEPASTEPGAAGIRVAGGATPDELAALLAVLTARPRPHPASRYELWRRTRLRALAPTDQR